MLVVDMVSHDREHYRRTMGHRHLGFEARIVTEMFRSAGLREIEVREIASEPDARGPGLFVATGRVNS